MTLFQQIAAALNWNLRLNENFVSVSPAGLYGRDPNSTTGLTWGYLGGNFSGVVVASGTVALTASATNYVVAHRTTGAVTVATNTTNWANTGTYLPLYQIVAGVSSVTSYDDFRQAIGGASGGGGGTPGGATTQVQYNLSGAFAGASNFTFASNTLSVPNITLTGLALTAASATGGAGFRMPHGAAPTSPTNGDVWTTSAGLYAQINGATVGPYASSAGTLTNPMNAVGDIIIGTTAGAPAKLAAGTNTYVLTMVSGSPAWAAAGGGSFTGGTLTSALNEAPTVTIASSATPAIGAAAGNTISLTGTTTVTGFDTIAAGAFRRVVFTGALTFTHNATSLILPSSANITTATGDVAEMLSLGSGNWRCTSYTRASGAALVSGGGGLTNWTEAVSSASPNGTVPVVSLTATNAASNVDAVIAPKAQGALIAAVPDSSSVGGNKRGAYAVDLQLKRSAAANVASANYAFIGGGQNNQASGSECLVVGGSSNVANNSQDAVCGGGSNTASGGNSFVGGGSSNTASGQYSATAGGLGNTASGTTAFACGNFNTANGQYSAAFGWKSITRSISGMIAHANGILSSPGDAQAGRYVFSTQTTNATPKALGTAFASASAGNTVVMPDNSTYDFVAYVVGRNGTTASASYKIEGTAKRGSGAGTVALVGTPTVTSKGVDAGASGWAVAVVANTSLGSIDVQVTGAAATTVNWLARIDTVELIA